MQFKQIRPQPYRRKIYLLLFLVCIISTTTIAQTTYFPEGDKANILIERLEIKARTDSALNFSKTKPYSRARIVPAITQFLNVGKLVKGAGEIPVTLDAEVSRIYGVGSRLTKIDLYNADHVLMNNSEWSAQQFQSKKPILKNFYKTPANLYEVHVKDFDLVVNPVIQFTLSKEKNNSQKLFQNTRGVTVRGRIANKIGFAAYMTDNQERDPLYVQRFINERKAVPGEGFYKTFKAAGGVDYFDARGYFTFNVTKYIDVTFGYDKNFIGNGHRSMFLSDFGNSNLFLRLNTRIWKLNYQNLFMELQNADNRVGDRLIGKKYAAMHHLDAAVTKWLNIGLFEGVIFGRKDHFDFGYLNPIIFYRSIEQQNGSFDNSVIGLDAKANIGHGIQLYGQLCLDEFLLSEIKKNRGWWANKWGIQIGAKYIDAFGIPNLDLQIEHNRVRPFTYSHRDSVANYTHYNQPLAHPLMANFKEFIAIARYQPAPKWLVTGKLIAYTQGRDSSSQSYGSNIFLPNVPPYRIGDFGYDIGSGWKTNVLYASFLLSYEIRENLFLELNAVARKEETKTAPITSMKTSVITFGVRWNMHRREFDF